MQWATKACNSVLVFTQLVGFLFVGCRLKDYSTFVILPSVWMNDFCPYFAWLGSIIMCSLAHKPWNHLLTQLTVKGGVSVLATENKRRRRIKIRKIPNRKTALLLSEFFQIVWGRPCYFKLSFRIKEIRIVRLWAEKLLSPKIYHASLKDWCLAQARFNWPWI